MNRFKLGKLAPKEHPATLLLKDYVSAVPAPPAKVYREYMVPAQGWGMYANDEIGDCTCACIAHMEMLMSEHALGAVIYPLQEDVVKLYSTVSGYDPATGLNDNGAAITDVLEQWRTKGLSGRKILGWAQIDHTNIEAVKQAIWLFGAVDIGVNLPKSAMDQFQGGKPWTLVANDGGIEGGHSFPLFGYGSQGCNGNTWATRWGIDWDAFLKYCDEAYAVVTQDWITNLGRTVSGFDLAQIQADLNMLKA